MDSFSSTSFDRAADFYDDTRGFPPDIAPQVAALLSSVANLHSHSNVLEIGIGTGRIALPLSEHVGSITGIDISRNMMDRLRKKRRDQAIYLTQTDATRLPFPNHAFDAAISVHVFHLISNWQAAVSELARALRSDGVLLACWGSMGQKWIRRELRARLPQERTWYRGALREDIIQHLTDTGWQPIANESLDFTVAKRPREFIERTRNRIWSNTWTYTEAELEAELALLTEILNEHYDDLDQLVDYESDFTVFAFRPPARQSKTQRIE